MKTTKKIIAAILAVMMLALMIPMTASAADTYSYTINTPSTAGYTFSIYKIADLNTTTGEYSSSNADVLTALKDGDNKDLLTAADALDAAALGTEVDSFTNTASEQHSNTVSEAGVYYVKVTGTPAGVNVKSVTNSVFSLPYYNEGTWVDDVTVEAATKINDGTPTVTKEFTSATTFTDADQKTSTSEFIGSDVQFTLTGSVVGSTTEKAKAYKFVDTMSAGLTFKEINSVKLTGGTGGTTEKDLTTTDYTYTKTGADNSFEIALSDTLLSGEEFYSYSNVVVTYTATLNSNAVIGGKGNPNKVDLVYTNSYDDESKIEGPEVRVYTAQIQVVKVDAANTTTKLSGAGFTLYTDAACNTVATNGSEQKTDSNGTVTFKGLKGSADGTTYYLKETTAPSGYNINSTVFEIEVFDNGTVSGTGVINNEIQVPDSKLVAPNTGGMGTAVFTICGASLVVLGGVLMLITLKKKKAAK